MDPASFNTVRQLLQQAREDKRYAKRYVKRARRLAEKERTPLPREFKKQFCNYCNAYWKVGENVRVRTQRGKVVYYCLECKHYRRFPYTREQKAKRAKVNKA